MDDSSALARGEAHSRGAAVAPARAAGAATTSGAGAGVGDLHGSAAVCGTRGCEGAGRSGWRGALGDGSLAMGESSELDDIDDSEATGDAGSIASGGT